MIPPLQRPKRKNPIVRTRQTLLPPWMRSRAALGLTAAAALGRFELQVCTACAAVQYPPREACHVCLGGDLQWRAQDGTGELLATTSVHVSHDPFFRERMPWQLAMVRLECGPTVVAHLHGACPPAPARVRVAARLDKAGQGVLVAFPLDEVPNMADDRQLREMTCDPKFRKALVTDGKKVQLWNQRRGERTTVAETGVQSRATIRLRVACIDGNRFRFAVQGADGTWTELAGETDGSFLPPWDRGLRTGLYVTGDKGAIGSFEYFVSSPDDGKLLAP